MYCQMFLSLFSSHCFNSQQLPQILETFRLIFLSLSFSLNKSIDYYL
jgi:hypothetical protein